MRFRTLSRQTLPDFEELFGDNGACGGCWCMWWRVPRGGKTWYETAGRRARLAIRKLAREGNAHGVLAYESEGPVGWCTFGPRAHFPRLDTVRAYRGLDESAGTWCVPCFFIRRDYRGKGLAAALLQAAMKEMKRRGARVAEGYPVTETREGKRLPAAFAYTGPLRLFTGAGFEIVHAANPRRPVVRRRLRGP